MERIRTVSGTGPVHVDSNAVGHCAFEINVYKDDGGRVTGRGYVMGDSAVLGKMAAGQRVELTDGDDKRRFVVSTSSFKPGDRQMDVEAFADILH